MLVSERKEHVILSIISYLLCSRYYVQYSYYIFKLASLLVCKVHHGHIRIGFLRELE